MSEIEVKCGELHITKTDDIGFTIFDLYANKEYVIGEDHKANIRLFFDHSCPVYCILQTYDNGCVNLKNRVYSVSLNGKSFIEEILFPNDTFNIFDKQFVYKTNFLSQVQIRDFIKLAIKPIHTGQLLRSSTKQGTPATSNADIKKLVSTPMKENMPQNDLQSGIKQLLRIPENKLNVFGISNLFNEEIDNNQIFNNLFDKKPLKQYENKSFIDKSPKLSKSKDQIQQIELTESKEKETAWLQQSESSLSELTNKILSSNDKTVEENDTLKNTSMSGKNKKYNTKITKTVKELENNKKQRRPRRKLNVSGIKEGNMSESNEETPINSTPNSGKGNRYPTRRTAINSNQSKSNDLKSINNKKSSGNVKMATIDDKSENEAVNDDGNKPTTRPNRRIKTVKELPSDSIDLQSKNVSDEAKNENKPAVKKSKQKTKNTTNIEENTTKTPTRSLRPRKPKINATAPDENQKASLKKSNTKAEDISKSKEKETSKKNKKRQLKSVALVQEALKFSDCEAIPLRRSKRKKN